jgi:hypothetical protein
VSEAEVVPSSYEPCQLAGISASPPRQRWITELEKPIVVKVRMVERDHLQAFPSIAGAGFETATFGL